MVNSQSMPKVDKDGIVNCRVWKAAVAWSLNMSSAGDCQSQFSGSLDVNVRELLAMSCHNESFQCLSLSNGMLLYADSTMDQACQKKDFHFHVNLDIVSDPKTRKIASLYQASNTLSTFFVPHPNSKVECCQPHRSSSPEVRA